MNIISKEPYNYHYRPGYKSKELLIEIFSGVEDENFMSDLFQAISKLSIRIDDIQDLWMNDEILLIIESNMGSFILSKDIWGLCFIMSENNQKCISEINKLLEQDIRFQKNEVDFKNYQ